MPRGKRTDPTVVILVKVMAEVGFAPGLIAHTSGLPNETVRDILQGRKPWDQMPRTELYELTRVRLIQAIDSVACDLGLKAIAKLDEKLNTASYMELISFLAVGLNRGDKAR